MKRLKSVVTAQALGALLWAGAPLARAQGDAAEGQLSFDRVAYIETGSYLAGDNVAFDLDKDGNHYLLRFADLPEVFVLNVDAGSFSGRILKYDSGEMALKVAGWGGMTLYTDAAPEGLPAVRTGDSVPPALASVSLQQIQSAANDDAERLAYVRRLNLQFTADWNAFAANGAALAVAGDAMDNADRGIDRFAQTKDARAAMLKRVSIVTFAPGARPGLLLKGRALMVTFNPGEGFDGRASSRAIARELKSALAAKR